MEKIIVFGRGDYFRKKSKTFFDRYEIVAFLDNSISQEIIGEEYGISLYNPNQINKLEKYPIYCVAVDFWGMWQQLRELGVEEERIRFGVEVAPQQPGIEELAFSKGETLRAKDDLLVYSTKSEKYSVSCLEELKDILRHLIKDKKPDISAIGKLENNPVSRTFGSERGKAVDRYYIEKFLESHAGDIKGTVMEVANNTYTYKYGGNQVEKSIVCHVLGWGKGAVKVNFETGEGIIENSIDCLICTQTLQYIFDLKTAMHNIYRMLKPNGVALITVPGIKPLCEYDNNLWGEYWSFTANSLDRLCSGICDKNSYSINQYGNSKAAVAYLYGICLEEMQEKDLEYFDAQYPFLVTTRVIKSEFPG